VEKGGNSRRGRYVDEGGVERRKEKWRMMKRRSGLMVQK
jgi:hypothetical protein